MKRIIIRNAISLLLIVACFVLQTTFFKQLAFAGIVPNLLIILVASFGFMRGEKSGLILGFICGLLVDIFFGEVLGMYALLHMYIGYCNGKFSRIFFPEDIKLPMLCIIVSDLVYGLLCYGLLFLLRGRFHFSYYFLNIMVPEIVYTLVITLVLYPVILAINTHLEQKEKESGQKFV